MPPKAQAKKKVRSRARPAPTSERTRGKRAEQQFAEPHETSEIRVADVRRLVRDLQVRKSELEMHDRALVAAREANGATLEQYLEVFDIAPIGFVVLGSERQVIHANHAFARLIGKDPAQMVGEPFLAYLEPQSLIAFGSMLVRATESGRREALDTRLVGVDGAPTVRITAGALQHSDRRLLLVVEDITEARGHKERLEKAEALLRETERRKDEFLAMLAHELRNPLAPIRNCLFLISRPATSAEQRHTAEQVIERQVMHLTRLVDDLLDVTRLARGKIQLRREPVELGALVRGVIEDHRGAFEAAGIRLEVAREEAQEAVQGAVPGLWVQGDSTRLVQAITNLLNNARRFTPTGGEVAVRLETVAGRAVLTVRDDGVGIARPHLEHVFEAFRQAPQAMDRARGGLGLGLTMVRGIVELHGGSVSVWSEGPGKGTEATVRLPLDAAPERTHHVPEGPAAAPRRVLIIEDNVDAAESLEQVLSLCGHSVRLAHDGPTGLEIARKFQPEIVVCDIGLPDMDGYEVARAFRADAGLRGAYLIAMSGYAQIEDRRRAAMAGFNQHMAKPPNLDRLERLMAEAPVDGVDAATAAPSTPAP